VFDDGTVETPDPPQRAVADQIELNSDAVAADQPLPAVIDEARLNVDLRAKELPLLDRGEEQRQERTRPWSQIAYGVPYALAAGALVSCAWLLIALFGKQWSQVSVLTLGLVVPWALFNSSTRKKRLGIRVWKETPPLIMISITSFAIFAVMTPVVEFLAFKAVYGSNPSNLPYSDFVQRYFKGTDWLLVACGLVLSLLTPFLLKVGAEWSKPSVRRKSGEAELTQQAEASKAELAADTAGAKQQLQAEDEEAAPDADVEADTEE
jgi:peptidoglycan/LPS O-acetylase OafA/YrhL